MDRSGSDKLSAIRIEVDVRQENVAHVQVPHAVLRYVIGLMTASCWVIARDQGPFSADEHIQENRYRSLLCIPLINQTKLIGILYLENSRTSHVFTPDPRHRVKILASRPRFRLRTPGSTPKRRKAEEALRTSEASLARGSASAIRGPGAGTCVAAFARDQPSACRSSASIQPSKSPTPNIWRSFIRKTALRSNKRWHRHQVRQSVFSYENRIMLAGWSIRRVQSTGYPTVDESGELDLRRYRHGYHRAQIG